MRRALVMAVLLFVAFSIANALSALVDGRVHAHAGELFRFAVHHPVLPAITAVIVAALWYLLLRRVSPGTSSESPDHPPTVSGPPTAG